MSLIKGQKEYYKHKLGKRLTRKEAILALCYDCNGREDSRRDCKATDCPLYQFHPYRGYKHQKNHVSGF